jgi:hypothetical protein
VEEAISRTYVDGSTQAPALAYNNARNTRGLPPSVKLESGSKTLTVSD